MKLPFIEIIEQIAPNPNLLMWKYYDEDKEIKNGAKLVVRESQCAMLLNEGELADIFTAGTHTLSTENIPILSRLKGWKYGFESPFKADIYFFNTNQFINLKWGTPAPILMPDKQFGNIRIRAFGAYNIRIKDIAVFFRQYAGTFPILSIMELEAQLRDFVAPKFGEVLAGSGFSLMDVAGNVGELSEKVSPLLAPFFAELGLELTKFQITSATLPKEVSEHLDKMAQMNMVGDMDRFKEFNIAQAIGNSDSSMSQGVQGGAMMGAMMGQMASMMQNQNSPNAQATQAQADEAPQPTQADDMTAKLTKLKGLFDAGLIDEQEFKTKKAEILDNL